MRYTTIIDLSEMPAIYRNHNARLLYLHLVIKAGYHDHDRDLIRYSIRNAAADVGITIAAARHALETLQAAGLIIREGETWRVKKWVKTESITPRKQSTTSKLSSETTDLIRKTEEEAEERRRRVDDWLSNSSISERKELLQRLENGRIGMVNGVKIYPKFEMIEWLKNHTKRK